MNSVGPYCFSQYLIQSTVTLSKNGIRVTWKQLHISNPSDLSVSEKNHNFYVMSILWVIEKWCSTTFDIFLGSYCFSQYLIQSDTAMSNKGSIPHFKLFYLSTPFDLSFLPICHKYFWSNSCSMSQHKTFGHQHLHMFQIIFTQHLIRQWLLSPSKMYPIYSRGMQNSISSYGHSE